MSDTRRRRLLLAASALLAAPIALAQKTARTYRVGVLLASGPGMERYRAALLERLAGHGFVEGRNLEIDARAESGDFSDDREYVRRIVAAGADAILAFSTRAAEAAIAARKSVPIVFVWVRTRSLRGS